VRLPTYKFETAKFSEGFEFVAGCDEVGIGPLAGPVVASAVVLKKDCIEGRRSKNKWWSRVRDSKTVNEKERNILAGAIKENCLAFSVAVVSHETVDRLNIFYAAREAMKQAIVGLSLKPQFVFIDGRHKLKNLDGIEQQAIVGGDALVFSIAAASILAKVVRDQILTELHQTYPMYNFHLNKGYPTKFHREALASHGPCPVHRKSFTLVKQSLNMTHMA
jgi:ribonuclease HII